MCVQVLPYEKESVYFTTHLCLLCLLLQVALSQFDLFHLHFFLAPAPIDGSECNENTIELSSLEQYVCRIMSENGVSGEGPLSDACTSEGAGADVGLDKNNGLGLAGDGSSLNGRVVAAERSVRSDAGRDQTIGIIFHCKEYPAYKEAAFPYNLGWCQVRV